MSSPRVGSQDWQAPLGYTSLSAQQDYRGRRDTVFVRVEINLTPTYPAILSSAGGVQLRSSEFWRDFSIRVNQPARAGQSKAIAPKRIRGRALYLFGESVPSQLRGAEVLLEFEADQISSESLRVEVFARDGQQVGSAEFDLAKLR